MNQPDYFETAKKIVREDALKKGYIKDDHEGRSLNHEDYVDDREQRERDIDNRSEP